MPQGRPTDYSDEVVKRGKGYLNNLPEGEVIHTLEGLAEYLQIALSTLYKWRKEEGKERFSELIEDLLSKQSKELLNHGLDGSYNPTIAKVILSKHGYNEKTEQELSGNLSFASLAEAFAQKEQPIV